MGRHGLYDRGVDTHLRRRIYLHSGEGMIRIEGVSSIVYMENMKMDVKSQFTDGM